MFFSRIALIFALAPVVSFSATLISQTRNALAGAVILGDDEGEGDETLLDGYALLEAEAHRGPEVSAEARFGSLISPRRFEVIDFFAEAFLLRDDAPSGAAVASINFEVLFEVSTPEIWFLDIFLNSAGKGLDAGVGAGLLLLRRGQNEVFFLCSQNPLNDETFCSNSDPVDESRTFILAPGIYQLDFPLAQAVEGRFQNIALRERQMVHSY